MPQPTHGFQKGELPGVQVCHLTCGGRAGDGVGSVQPLRERGDGRGGRGRARVLFVGQASSRGGERGGRACLPARLALCARLRPLRAALRQRPMSKRYQLSFMWTAPCSQIC